jgi:hypothetical protein
VGGVVKRLAVVIAGVVRLGKPSASLVVTIAAAVAAATIS